MKTARREEFMTYQKTQERHHEEEIIRTGKANDYTREANTMQESARKTKKVERQRVRTMDTQHRDSGQDGIQGLGRCNGQTCA